MLFRRLVLSALLVGALSGILLSVVQLWQVIPIIEAAERHEQARAPQAAEPAHAHAPGAHPHADQPAAGHVHEAGAWEPADGFERTGFTVLSNVLTAAGFALVLLAAMAMRLGRPAATRAKAAGIPGWQQGLLWGLAGYAVFFVAPTLGLPPEIPGAEAAPLESRQLWWTLTVACSAAGLTLLAFGQSPWRWAGLALLVLPHLAGAPQLGTNPFAEFPAAAAAELKDLARRFVWATALANGVFWLALGGLSGWAIQRFVRKAAA